MMSWGKGGEDKHEEPGKWQEEPIIVAEGWEATRIEELLLISGTVLVPQHIKEKRAKWNEDKYIILLTGKSRRNAS